jgi:hypothetical protein
MKSIWPSLTRQLPVTGTEGTKMKMRTIAMAPRGRFCEGEVRSQCAEPGVLELTILKHQRQSDAANIPPLRRQGKCSSQGPVKAILTG